MLSATQSVNADLRGVRLLTPEVSEFATHVVHASSGSFSHALPPEIVDELTHQSRTQLGPPDQQQPYSPPEGTSKTLASSPASSSTSPPTNTPSKDNSSPPDSPISPEGNLDEAWSKLQSSLARNPFWHEEGSGDTGSHSNSNHTLSTATAVFSRGRKPHPASIVFTTKPSSSSGRSRSRSSHRRLSQSPSPPPSSTFSLSPVAPRAPPSIPPILTRPTKSEKHWTDGGRGMVAYATYNARLQRPKEKPPPVCTSPVQVLSVVNLRPQAKPKASAESRLRDLLTSFERDVASGSVSPQKKRELQELALGMGLSEEKKRDRMQQQDQHGEKAEDFEFW